MKIEKVFHVLQAIYFNHKKVAITYINSMGYTKTETGNFEIERNWAYLYEDGKSGNDYIIAFPIPNTRIINIDLVSDDQT